MTLPDLAAKELLLCGSCGPWRMRKEILWSEQYLLKILTKYDKITYYCRLCWSLVLPTYWIPIYHANPPYPSHVSSFSASTIDFQGSQSWFCCSSLARSDMPRVPKHVGTLRSPFGALHIMHSIKKPEGHLGQHFRRAQSQCVAEVFVKCQSTNLYEKKVWLSFREAMSKRGWKIWRCTKTKQSLWLTRRQKNYYRPSWIMSGSDSDWGIVRIQNGWPSRSVWIDPSSLIVEVVPKPRSSIGISRCSWSGLQQRHIVKPYQKMSRQYIWYYMILYIYIYMYVHTIAHVLFVSFEVMSGVFWDVIMWLVLDTC